MRTRRFQISRRRFFGGVSVAVLGGLGYARLFEAERLQKNYVTVQLFRDRKPPLKLLHLSDLHASPVVSLGYIRKAIDVAVEWKPDLICVTGDFITQTFSDAAAYAKILRRLSGTAPTFASLGNHDGGKWAGENGGCKDITWVSQMLKESGVQLLHNDSVKTRVGHRELNLVGLSDIWANDFDAQRAFSRQSGCETIVLSHNPDTKDQLDPFNWELMLSGHTHGGQLRVPWLGATPFAPVRDKRFVAGLREWNGRWIHVTKGIGSVFGLRINCPPELSFLTLT